MNGVVYRSMDRMSYFFLSSAPLFAPQNGPTRAYIKVLPKSQAVWLHLCIRSVENSIIVKVLDLV